jgi:multicomponent Na+:H+ antiporter subunit B
VIELVCASILILMVLTVWGIIRTRNLFAIVALSGIYSFFTATLMVALDAVDVAMTEAAVGAGVSTVLLLGALYLCRSQEAEPMERPWGPLVLAGLVTLALFHGMVGLPGFSDPGAPIHTHVAPRYLLEMPKEVDMPNAVTAVLASYRGYDTLGETTVVFTAGAGVLALLRRGRRRQKGKS